MASVLVVALVVLFVPFFILGVLGNIGVILCVVLTPSLRTRANAIIVSLATSCLAFLLTVVPFTLDSFLHTNWRFAVWYCHATAYLSFAFIGITVFNIAALSLYRYFCVVHPARRFLRGRASLVLLVSVSWIVPLTTQTLLASCHIARTEYIPVYARCVLVKAGQHSTLYNVLVLGGFLPTLGLTLYSYAGIYATVRLSARRLRRQAATGSWWALQARATASAGAVPGGESCNPVGAPREPRREKHYPTRICVAVFALFMICYGPIVTLTAVYAHDGFPPLAYMVCTVVYWLGSCLHPLAYAILQPQIRRSLGRLASCCQKSAAFPAESSVVPVTSGP